MNHCVPHWILEDDNRYLGELLPAATPQKSMVPDSELIELLWQNGHVAMHNQTHQKCQTATTEFKQAPKPGPLLKCGGSLVNANDLIQDEETLPWFEYSLDDSLEKEFSTGFFCGTPIADATDAYKLNKELTAREKGRNFVIKESNSFTGFASKHSSRSFQENKVPVPNSNVSDSTQRTASLEEGGALNFSHYSRPIKAGLEFLNRELEHNKPGNKNPGGMVESSSTMSIRLSACENSHIEKLVDESCTFSNDVRNAHTRSRKDDDQMSSPHERVQSNAHEATATSSSGGSGSSFARAGHRSMSNQNHKRKGRGGESESHSEEAEYESVEANKRAQRSASARRTRAAEVHNLSERTDKASMLDEAIEYLKSLQLQVQMMWMGSGMAPMMHPGFQSYMPHMGMGMNLAHMPSFPDPIRLPTVPVVNQAIPSSAPIANSASMCSTPALNQDNFPTQMQNIDLTESYARYLSFHHKQQPNQTMYTYGSQTMQQNQQSGSSINMPTAGTAPPAKHSK